MSVQSKLSDNNLSQTKKSQRNTTKKRSANAATLYNDPKSLLSWREMTPTEGVLNHIASSLMEWSELESSIDYIDFFRQYPILSSTYYKWLASYPDLKAIHLEVKQRLGARREKLAIYREKNCDPGTLKMTLRQYHPEWEAVWNSEAALRADEKIDKIILEIDDGFSEA